MRLEIYQHDVRVVAQPVENDPLSVGGHVERAHRVTLAQAGQLTRRQRGQIETPEILGSQFALHVDQRLPIGREPNAFTIAAKPDRRQLNGEAFAHIPNGSAKLKGLATGRTAANEIIRLRRKDGRLTPIGVSSSFPKKTPGPGVWRLTPPAFAAPQMPWVGSVQSDGAAVSGTRTAEQTAVARFWTANVIRQYNGLGRDIATARALDLPETARLLAMINIVGADAQISVMHWKYEFLFWRPVTAIDPLAVTDDGFGPVPGFEDGSSGAAEETGWRPLVTTPNHPEYPAAHGSITSAVAEVLRVFLGTDQIDVDIHGFDASGGTGNLNATRHFETVTQLRTEIVNARVWAGVHYRGSGEAGVVLGRRVAAYDLARAFRASQ
jgi:hypothetical protein